MEALVIKSTGKDYILNYGGQKIISKVRGKMRLDMIRTTNPIAVGDIVEFEFETPQTGIITSVKERKNCIIRKSVNLSKENHIIASNLDQCMLILTLIMPETSLEFVDRFLVSAMAYKVPAILVFNKSDMYTGQLKDLLIETMEIYSKIGYKTLAVSSVTKEGIEELKALLKGKVTLLSGNSGTGKSTLINTVNPGLNLKTGEISQYSLAGKHTTTFAEMFDLSFSGKIIDTPGIKGFGLTGMSVEDISHNFPEMFQYLSRCKFYNCTHTHEPGCAVKEAVDNGEISPSRYHSYLSILSDTNSKYRQKSH